MKEYDLLLLFLRNKNRALYRETIYENVWGGEYSGTGRTVDLHQGSWQFESEPGKGMRITVLFGLPDVTGRRRVRRRRPEKREKQIGKRHGRRADG